MASLDARLAPPLFALACGCLGTNPWYVGNQDETATTSDTGDGDGDTGDGDGDTGDGDGDTGDGDGDGDSSTCTDGRQNGEETDIDCGGECEPCEDGLACGDADDCVSGVCEGSTCQVPSCIDEVQNGQEIGIDCGGPDCGFCQHGNLSYELDDFEGSAATNPRVAMFADGSFALTYNGPMQARARWFDEFGMPKGVGVPVSATVQFVGNRPIPLFAGTGAQQPIHVLVAGTDAMSMSTDLFLVRRTPASEETTFRVNALNQLVNEGDLTVDGTKAAITWTISKQVVTRRLDYNINNGSWIDINAFEAEPMPAQFEGGGPAMAKNGAGLSVVAWVRCESGGYPCDLAARRFDAGWLDPEPVLAPGVPPDLGIAELQVSIAEDGRVGVIFTLIGLGETTVGGWLLDANFESEGPIWLLQESIPSSTAGDVAALSDGSFAFAWPDTSQGRVHLRRFVGPDQPLHPNAGDESPWPMVDTPRVVSVSSVAGRLVVVWSAIVDSVAQIQGQVLSY